MAVANAKETAALKMFRHRISDLISELDDYYLHDQTLLRFLRARELNLDRAEDMFRKHLQWRKDNDIDNVRSIKLPDFIEQSYCFQPSGFDKEGALVAAIPFGLWDVRKAMDNGYRPEFFIFVEQVFEQALAFLRHKSTKEKCLTQVNLIVDYEHFSVRQLYSREVAGLIIDVLKMFEANFPETLKTCYIVNAPAVFQLMYKLIKPIASAHTLAKIQIFGSNQDEWKAALLKSIEPDQLPSQYGGTNTTPVEYRMKYGFDIFHKYDSFPEDEMKQVTVLPGQKLKIDVHDVDAGTEIAWNFKTEDYNVGFSVCMGENEVLVKPVKTDSHKFTQKGKLYCEKSGSYTLIFDNSFSKFRAKNLKYTVARRNPNKFIM